MSGHIFAPCNITTTTSTTSTTTTETSTTTTTTSSSTTTTETTTSEPTTFFPADCPTKEHPVVATGAHWSEVCRDVEGGAAPAGSSSCNLHPGNSYRESSVLVSCCGCLRFLGNIHTTTLVSPRYTCTSTLAGLTWTTSLSTHCCQVLLLFCGWVFLKRGKRTPAAGV